MWPTAALALLTGVARQRGRSTSVKIVYEVDDIACTNHRISVHIPSLRRVGDSSSSIQIIDQKDHITCIHFSVTVYISRQAGNDMVSAWHDLRYPAVRLRVIKDKVDYTGIRCVQLRPSGIVHYEMHMGNGPGSWRHRIAIGDSNIPNQRKGSINLNSLVIEHIGSSFSIIGCIAYHGSCPLDGDMK